MSSAADAPSTLHEEPASAALRAARAVLFLGLAELILFGVATFGVTRAAGMSITELHSITGASFTHEQLQAVHPHLKSFAAVLALCGVVPAGIYIVCATGIRKAIQPAVIVAMVLAATQLFVLGGVLIRQVLVAFAAGSPPTLTFSVLAIGTPMALLIVVLRLLMQLTKARPRAAAAPA